MSHAVMRSVLASIFLALPGALVAAGQGTGQAPAHEILAQMRADPGASAAVVNEGRQSAAFCANCHGDDGNSRFPEVPNLAGQHPVYVLTQIDAFLTGKRKDDFMQGLMKVLSERDKAAIAQYYGSAPPRPASGAGPRAAEGAKLYGQLCARCHQADARGGETFPRLAGQQREYIRTSLKRYLSLSGERFYAPMTAAVTQLGAANIDAVADYLSALD